MDNRDLKFTLSYAISLIIVLTISIYLMKSIPTLHPVIVIVVGLVVAYLFMTLINLALPSFASTTNNVTQYMEYSVYSNLNDLGYFNIWPPIFVVLLLFIILLYNGQLQFSSSSANRRNNNA
jgi:hypothetical protein